MANFNADNYTPAELMVVEKLFEILNPFLEKISTAKTKDEKLAAVDQLYARVKKEITSDVSGLKKPVIFTIICEKFYTAGGIFQPSDNDKLNFTAADAFFSKFKQDFPSYVFDRASILDFDAKILDRFVIALAKMSRTDPTFRAELIPKLKTIFETKRGKIDASVTLAGFLVPLIKARELLPTLEVLSKDGKLSEGEKEIYRSALLTLKRELDLDKDKPMPMRR